MRDLRNSWVTVVNDEESCLKALVLAQSLRQVLTTADIVALATQDLPQHLKIVLSEVFDLMMEFPHRLKHHASPCTTTLDEAKIYSWKLTMYTKCIVLDPSILVVKNCDELFDHLGDLSMFRGMQNQEEWNTQVVILKPGYRDFIRLEQFLIRSGTLGEKLPLWEVITKALPEAGINVLNNDIIKLAESQIHTTLAAVKLLNFGGAKPWVTQKETNVFATEVWMKIFTTAVLPCISDAKTSPINIISKLANQLNLKNCSPYGITKSRHTDFQDSIAIVGQSCRLPGANSVEEFWQLLESAGDGITTIPLERLKEHQTSDPRFTSVKAGFLKCPIEDFDARFFGISPREAAFMDPQQRLMVEVAWEALEDAAINPLRLKGSNTGVFSGVWTHEYERLLTENTTGRDFHHVVLGNAFSATSARVSYFLGLNGPNVATESGCSSSMVALHLACDSLRKKETDLALATGVNLLIDHFPHSEVSILAKDGHCKTFDENADGFARAEGVVVMVLKRLADAMRDGDKIISIVRGSGLSNEGTTSSFGTPSKFCQEIAIKEALKVARVRPEEVDYVEAHGTGTPIGDPIEFSAISAGYKSQRTNPLIVGSVKTNTGHTESAAGLTGVLKVNLAMENELIPAHRNVTAINPNIDLNALPAQIPLHQLKWSKNPSRKRLAGVSSFGISGTNVHVILEEPPILSTIEIQRSVQDKTQHLLTLSAKTENALKDLVENYSTHLIKHPELTLKDICYTSNIGRQHLKHRIPIVAKDLNDLKTKLLLSGVPDEALVTEKPKIAFLFTGQGSQYSSMAKTLYQTSPVFHNALNLCDTILKNNVQISIIDVLFKDTCTIKLDETLYSQTSIFCIEYGLLKLWESLGIKPAYVLGHSVGEFAASVAAQIMSLEESLILLARRSQLIHNLPSGGMLAIRANEETSKNLIESFCLNNPGDWLDIAVINSAEEVVVAGKSTSLCKFTEFCTQQNIKSQLLAASHAFHSRDMEAMLSEFEKSAGKVEFKSPGCEYVSGSTGQHLYAGDMNSQYWKNHARYRVDFTKGIKLLHNEGCNVFIEIGAHPILLALGMTNLSSIEAQNTLWLPSIRRNEDNWTTVFASVSKLYANGFDFDWESFHLLECSVKVHLPHYPFQRQTYWIESKNDALTKPLHPLLGRKIPLAVIKDHVFQNTLNLNDFPYLLDHQVVNIIVLPGAGFAEIILAAAKEVLKDESSQCNIVVEDFAIEAPMELEEEKLHKIQVVVSKIENSDNLMVKVFVYKKLNGYNDEMGWQQFASGRVSSNSERMTGKLEESKSRCLEEFDSHEFYEKTSQVGIKFGKTFQSIKRLWKGSNEVIAEIRCPTEAGNIKEYILHPIVLDAMIQTAGLSNDELSSDLYLPVGVNRLTMFDTHDSSTFFAHAFKDGISVNVHLFDGKSNLLCCMEGVRLVKTSIGSFMNVICGQKNLLPGLYQEIWRPRQSSFQSRANLALVPKLGQIMGEVKIKMHEAMNTYYMVEQFSGMCDKIVSLMILKNFLKLGWKPHLEEIMTVRSFMNQLLLIPTHEMLIDRFFDILQEDGYLKPNGNFEETEWKVIKLPEGIDQISKQIDIEVSAFDGLPIYDLERHIIFHCADNMSNVLLGELSGVDLLFGNDDPEINPLIIFTKGKAVALANLRSRYYLESKFNDIKTHGSILRILEVGAGSGATTNEILNGLHNIGIPFRYTFTDISPLFLEKAKTRFESISSIEYKVLNIENDPKYQGFIPNSYDVIIAANVIHATENIANSIKNVRQLLVPKGTLVLQEMLQPVRYIDFIYGTVEGYWKFKDFDIRTNHPCIKESAWRNVLLHNGFKSSHLISEGKEFSSIIVAEATDSDHRYVSKNNMVSPQHKTQIWIVFSCCSDIISNSLKTLIEVSGDGVVMIASNSWMHKNQVVDHLVDYSDEKEVYSCLTDIHESFTVKGVVVLQGLDKDNHQESFCRTSLYIAKYLASSNNPCKIIVVTRGVYSIGDQEKMYPDQSTICGVFKAFQNERLDFHGELVDLDPDVENDLLDAQHIFAELWYQNDSSVAYRNSKRHVLKCVKLQTASSPLDLPSGRFEIVIPPTKKINDVIYKTSKHGLINAEELEVCVKAAALNFRDIFTILKPDTYISKFEAVGTDFSGVVSKVGDGISNYKIGDEVFGISNRSSIASHVIVNSNLVLHKPKQFTFAEASTLPSVFLTAFHCLVSVAKLKRGESILIHVASGGVGLVAVQIAQSLGVDIIATAGSKRKRAFLKSLGLKHVFHSRDLSFGEDIERVTNGKGVDMVLNSLTGPGFKETSLKSCAINSRFVEMGKVNIWQAEDVKNLRPDVEYTIVNLETVSDKEMEILMNAMQDIVGSTGVKPLPFTRFFASNIKDALNYFLKAQHIGKIVVTMPELKESLGKQFKSDLLFSGNGTYLVTGGLGGIGLEVSKWMVKCGARNVVLVGRTDPSERTQQVLKMLSCKGVKVLSMQVDVGDLEQCENLFAIMKAEMPPLRGVIHSAGALSDGMIRNQTWEKFEIAFNAKVRGGWNLHELTKHMVLEHFVMFSSLAALVGPLGQSNHSAANMFLDSLAFYRHSLGLPAQTINWGPWSEVGAATNTTFGKEGALGLKPISPSQGISALQFIMSQPIVQLAVMHIDFSEYIDAIPGSHGYFSEVLDQDGGNNTAQLNAAGEKFWNDVESLNEQDRAIHIKKCIESIVRLTLKLPESETVDEHQQFSEMGMDSLMAVEMRNKLQLIFGRNLVLNPTSLLDYPTIAGLSNYLAKLTMSVDVKSQESITTETNAKVIKELSLSDSVLPGSILASGEPVRPSDIKSILLTGVTGHLGPHLLKVLAEKENCLIHCLVRGKSLQIAEKRIKDNMKKFGLSFSLINVRIVLGDITQPNLGMTTGDYEKLARNIDAVFHCAVKANHVEQYKISKSGKDIRSVNVLGTIKVLEFAGTFKTKRVAFMSSYSAANVLNENGVVPDEFPSIENEGEGLVFGYPLTKFVCEKLMNQANRLGIPCTVFRFPTLIGHSETGHFTTDTNFIMNLIFTSARLKVFIDIPGGWYSLPVDIAAKLSKKIFFNDQAETGLYNVICNAPLTSNAYVNVANEMGISQKLVSQEEFQDLLDTQNDPLIEIFKEATRGKKIADLGRNTLPAFKMALDGDKHIFEISRKLYKAVSNIEDIIPSPLDTMRRQIKYAIHSGMLDQLGIEYHKQ